MLVCHRFNLLIVMVNALLAVVDKDWQRNLAMEDSVTFEQAKEYIAELDLDYIVEKMCAEDYPLPRWTRSDANHCAKIYKNFLLLKKKHFGVPIVPTKEIDEFWHNHILHTQQYIHDCNKIYGCYMHHAPASSTDNLETLIQEFEQTKQLYLAEFGNPLDGFEI